MRKVTWGMLEPVRKAADDSCLPMTVWPSNNIGIGFAGLDRLIIFVPAELGEAPADPFRGSMPLVTVLPKHGISESYSAMRPVGIRPAK